MKKQGEVAFLLACYLPDSVELVQQNLVELAFTHTIPI